MAGKRGEPAPGDLLSPPAPSLRPGSFGKADAVLAAWVSVAAAVAHAPAPRHTGHGHRATRCCPWGQGCSTALEQGKGKSRGELLARQDAALRVCLYTARGRKNARDLAKRTKPQEAECLGGHCRPERPLLCQENAFSCPKTSGLQPPGWFVCVCKAVRAERERPRWPRTPPNLEPGRRRGLGRK